MPRVILTMARPSLGACLVVYQLADAGPKVLFYHPTVRPAVNEVQPELTGVTLVSLADVWSIADQMPPEPYPVAIAPRQDIAALFYSSGTTGPPKGVMLTHYNLVANICQACACFSSTALARPLAFLLFFHIYGFTLILNTTLALGGKCVITPAFDPKMVLELIRQQQITNLPTVPAALLALVNHPGAEQYASDSLRLVLCGAYAVPAEIERRAEQLFPGATFVEGYGLTEAAPLTNLNSLGYVRSGTFVPVSDTLEQVVSLEAGTPAALGEPGELWVRGLQVMKGYWQRPTESAQTLTPDGWLRTGDLVRAGADGYIAFVDAIPETASGKTLRRHFIELERQRAGQKAG